MMQSLLVATYLELVYGRNKLNDKAYPAVRRHVDIGRIAIVCLISLNLSNFNFSQFA